MAYSLQKDLELTIEAAKLAGEITRKFFGQEIEVTEKSPNNPVTNVDILVDKFSL